MADREFQVLMDTVNAAFEDDGGTYEVARILREVADKLEDGATVGNLWDVNGNRVGTFGFQVKE